MNLVVCDYKEEKEAICRVRETVFVEEQNVPPELEQDGKDVECIHAVVFDDGIPIGTGRLQKSGKIGRMAVLSSYRGKGVGRQLLTALVDSAAEHKIAPIYLNAQKGAVRFYEKSGFQPEGSDFKEAGIWHVKMVLNP